MNENMENAVMNEEAMGDVMSTDSTIGGKVGKGLLVLGVGAAIGVLVRKGIKKLKAKRQAKKEQKGDVVDVEYTEVPADDEQ